MLGKTFFLGQLLRTFVEIDLEQKALVWCHCGHCVQVFICETERVSVYLPFFGFETAHPRPMNASKNFTIPVLFNEHRKSQAPIPAHTLPWNSCWDHSPLGFHVDGDIATPWLTLLPSPIHMCHLFWWILWTWRFAWIFLIGWKCLNARDIPYIMYAYKYTT